MNFFFDSVDSLHSKCHTISANCSGSYIDSPKWRKNKKDIPKFKDHDGKYFQYAITIALNHQNIKCNPVRVSEIKLFINPYDWKQIS